MNKQLLLCFLICLNSTDYAFAQWTKKDSVWLQNILSGKEKLQLNPETMKAIQSGSLINPDKPANSMILSTPSLIIKDFSSFIQPVDTGKKLPDYRKMPPSVFMKYGPTYVDEPRSFKIMRSIIKEEYPRSLSSGISFGDILDQAFLPSARAKRRNAKRAGTWQNYNNLPTPDIIKKRKQFQNNHPEAFVKNTADTIKINLNDSVSIAANDSVRLINSDTIPVILQKFH